MRKIICIGLAFLSFKNLAAQNYKPDWESLDSRPVPQWFKDSKFGIFIHWGVYSVPGWCTKGNYAEWYQYGLQTNDSARMKYHQQKFGNRTYYDLANDFKAELFNPDEWANLFEQSGAKYIVLTSKHHDGFTLWPDSTANKTWGFPWNAGDVGPRRDLLGDLFKAVRKTSVHAGMYYSLFEWFNPLWKSDKSKYAMQRAWPQMKTLINTYKPDVFWTDGDWEASENLWKSKEFLAWMYNESPVKDKVVTYDRWGSEVRFKHGAVFTPEYQPDLDFEDHYWEESRGMGFSYGYNRGEDAWDYNSTQSLILQLIDKVSRGGNFLLDIGPDEHGKIPPIMQERLLQMGEWLKVNGESIYNTVKWKLPSQWSAGRTDYKPASGSGDLLLKLTVDPEPGYAVKEVFYTYNVAENSLYAIFPRYPETRKLVLRNMKLPPETQVGYLTTRQPLLWAQSGNDVVVNLPEYDPNVIKAPYAYVVKIFNYGNFLAKPRMSVGYEKNTLSPTITLSAAPSTNIFYTTDGTIPTDRSMLYKGPFRLNRSATVKAVAYQDPAVGPFSADIESAVVSMDVKNYDWMASIKVQDAKPGISYTYYEPSGKIDMNVLKTVPVASGVTDIVSVAKKQRADRFAFEFTGYLKIDKDGLYNLFTASDDGSILFVDDMEVVNNDGDHGTVEKSGRAALRAGFHKIRVQYFDSGGGNELHVSIQSEDGPKKEIPAAMLFH